MAGEAEDLEDVSLSDVFNDDEPEVTESPPEPEVEASQGETEEPEPKVDAQASEESPATTSEAEEPEAETPAAEPNLSKAELGRVAAVIAERDKRQKAERENEELKKRLGEYEDVSEDAPRVSVEQEMLQNKIELSRDVMSELDEDFQSTYEPHFMSMVMDAEGNVTDERLLAEFQQSRNPAKFARDTAKKDLKVREVTDPNFEKNLRESIRAELLKEIEEAGVSAVDVPDLTSTADSGSNSLPVVEEETLKDMDFALDQ